MKRTQTILITTVMLSIALTSVFAFDTNNNNTTLDIPIPFAVEASSDYDHEIVMEAVAMPDGLYAYRMVSYDKGDEELVGTVYSGKPSIPGPTIVLTEGDNAKVTIINNACDDTFVNGPAHPLLGEGFESSETSMIGIHVHGVHYDIKDDATYGRMNMNGDSGVTCGGSIDYEWNAALGTQGAWPYHDHTFSINEVGAEGLGLFGTVIVNPENGEINGLVVDNGVGTVIIDDENEPLEKEFILWMVSSETLGRSIFYGNEIDYSTTQYDGETIGMKETALWTNPNLLTREGGNYRFHVLGLGDEVHAFHLHGHRWTEDIHQDADVEDVIDVKEISPLQRHSFIIKASDNAGADDDFDKTEGWMYHCHVEDHMQEGMTGMMTVLPEYYEDDLPDVGAVFTLSDEPGVWMKTLDAGFADELDNILAEDLDVPIQARNGTGFPLGYISDAVEELLGAGTDFSNSEGRSLAVISPGETVLFGMKDSQTKHTITALIYPTAAQPDEEDIGGNGILSAANYGFFDQQLGIRGSTFITNAEGQPIGLDEPGIYVFVCKIHPYMFSAVIVDNPETNLHIGGPSGPEFPLLDLSDGLTVLTRTDSGFPTTNVPPTDPLITTLLTTFYVITDSNNWKDYTQEWNVSLPPVLVTTSTEEIAVGLAFDTTLVNATLDGLTLTNATSKPIPIGLALGGSDIPLPSVEDPNTSGIGEVWVNTQFETTLNKNHEGTPSDKPGTITVVDAEEWEIERKISLPEINLNNPHNMWTDAKNEVIYQTAWFGSEMAIIDRESGELIHEVFTGQSPSHVITSPETGNIYVAVNGEETVNEFDPETYELERQLSTGWRSHPHGHWASSDGQYIVTPDFIGLKASIIDLWNDSAYSSDEILIGPIATGMKGDKSEFFTADFLGNTNTSIDPSNGIIDGSRTIDWLDYGLVGLPIQTPISPDDQWMVTALTLGGKIGVVDVSADPPTVEILDCDPGCHGVQWGAKEGGGYYAYVSSKFSNVLTVVDPDPNGDGDGSDAEIAGRILLADDRANTDDRVIGYDGMGGQGVLAIPNVYEGWIQETVELCSSNGNNPGPCGKEVRNFVRGLDNDQKDPLG
jgi:plastocyanin